MADDFDLRTAIANLGISQTGLTRRMIQLGDGRTEKNIVRSIQRMIAGDARVSGEVRALLGLMGRTRGLVAACWGECAF